MQFACLNIKEKRKDSTHLEFHSFINWIKYNFYGDYWSWMLVGCSEFTAINS